MTSTLCAHSPSSQAPTLALQVPRMSQHSLRGAHCVGPHGAHCDVPHDDLHGVHGAPHDVHDGLHGVLHGALHDDLRQL